eukprot:TRINITY_DN385_c0_g2_i12.p1 TRINITY_DN385_c0_g2~~TRINITY_DN385_c0_g2_i12.p1  ORF type:complete len:111 (+),score=38.35 TRINITY_DN385_c0_g2_i12:243-575(+)
MRFTFLIFLALASCVLMEKFHKHDRREIVEDYVTEKVALQEELTQYFHKKMCYCIEAREAICWKLKCCDIYQYVPYKVFIKLCKFGECKFVEKPVKEKVIISEKHAGVSA